MADERERAENDAVASDDWSADERADAAIRAIAGGADPSAESFALANRFTDEQSARFGKWLRSLFGRQS